MEKDAKATYRWVAENGVVNFDLHGDGSGQSISHEGRGCPWPGRCADSRHSPVITAGSGAIVTNRMSPLRFQSGVLQRNSTSR